MDGQRLERLSRALAAGPTRRRVLAALLGTLVTRQVAVPKAADAAEGWVADARGFGICRLPGFPCGSDSQCCAGGCKEDGTCGCRKSGKSAWLKAICCSGKKKKGNKGKCR